MAVSIEFQFKETWSRQGQMYSVEGMLYKCIAWKLEHAFGPGYHTLYSQPLLQGWLLLLQAFNSGMALLQD
jgi:hypothetical protein